MHGTDTCIALGRPYERVCGGKIRESESRIKKQEACEEGQAQIFFFLNHLLKCLLGSHKEHPNPFGECDFSLNSKSHTTLSPRDMTFTTGDLGETTSQPLSQL